jgi:aminoglycoside phosphotransferase (APT) family kinase protein
LADLATPLAAWLERRIGKPVTVGGLVRLPGGASRETWLFTLGRPGAPDERLVLRRDPAGHASETSRAQEFVLLEAAAAAGVPVPRVRWCESDPSVLGGAFFVMDFVEGETIARRLLRDDAYARARDVLPEQLAAALVRIHALDLTDPALAGVVRPPDGVPPAAAELARWETIFRGIAPEPHPAFELAFRWLAARTPTRTRRVLVHGDYRMGNVIVGAEGLRAVIDWELVHVGDPMEDLGWLCVRAWRFGVDAKPVGGLCGRGRLFAAYAAAGGGDVDPADVRWWEVCGNLKWGIMCIMQMQAFLCGVRSVELASIGRRTAETELELLDLMAGA